jgi:hypothetical protein
MEKAKNINDVSEIERQFQVELRDDYDMLKEALRMHRNDTLLSTTVAAPVLASLGYLIPQLAVPFGSAAAWSIVTAPRKYQADRRKILAQHPTAWLLENTRSQPKDLLYRLPYFPAIG